MLNLSNHEVMTTLEVALRETPRAFDIISDDRFLRGKLKQISTNVWAITHTGTEDEREDFIMELESAFQTRGVSDFDIY